MRCRAVRRSVIPLSCVTLGRRKHGRAFGLRAGGECNIPPRHGGRGSERSQLTLANDHARAADQHLSHAVQHQVALRTKRRLRKVRTPPLIQKIPAWKKWITRINPGRQVCGTANGKSSTVRSYVRTAAGKRRTRYRLTTSTPTGYVPVRKLLDQRS
jgi:hypothetical protein